MAKEKESRSGRRGMMSTRRTRKASHPSLTERMARRMRIARPGSRAYREDEEAEAEAAHEIVREKASLARRMEMEMTQGTQGRLFGGKEAGLRLRGLAGGGEAFAAGGEGNSPRRRR